MHGHLGGQEGVVGGLVHLVEIEQGDRSVEAADSLNDGGGIVVDGEEVEHHAVGTGTDVSGERLIWKENIHQTFFCFQDFQLLLFLLSRLNLAVWKI